MKQYVVDAFTDRVFAGNPAAVCVMGGWLNDVLMQKITVENNLSETAFCVKENDNYHLRWFTPGGEIDLCGHATLATAYVITRFIEPDASSVSFNTLSGLLTVKRNGELLEMVFPAYELRPVEVTDAMTEVIGAKPVAAFMGRDLLCILDDKAAVFNCAPDMAKVMQLDGLLLHITAKGTKYDCVSRSFAPKCGVPEDPVCGSGHCHIIPYWAKAGGKAELVAYQASARSGILYTRMEGDKVILAGKAALFSESEIYIG